MFPFLVAAWAPRYHGLGVVSRVAPNLYVLEGLSAPSTVAPLGFRVLRTWDAVDLIRETNYSVNEGDDEGDASCDDDCFTG